MHIFICVLDASKNLSEIIRTAVLAVEFGTLGYFLWVDFAVASKDSFSSVYATFSESALSRTLSELKVCQKCRSYKFFDFFLFLILCF